MSATLFPLLFLVALAADDAPSAAARFDEARRLFDNHQYLDAAQVFSDLQVQTGDTALLYPTAQSLRLAGRCPEALVAYERFISEGDRLRERAQSAAAGSGVKRLSGDLVYAAARVVEMRTCLAAGRAQDARHQAQQLIINGDPVAAIGKLQPVWTEAKDASILPEIADLHRSRGDCKQSAELMDQAVKALSPIENLREAAAPGSHLARAVDALRRARAAKQDPSCVEGVAAAAGTKPAIKLASSDVPAAPPPMVDRPGESSSTPTNSDRAPGGAAPRWPLWTAGAGGVLLVGAGISFWQAKKAADELSALVKPGGYTKEAAEAIEDRGEQWNLAGKILVTTGAVVGVGSLVYYFVTKGGDPGTGPGAQITSRDAVFSWTGRF